MNRRAVFVGVGLVGLAAAGAALYAARHAAAGAVPIEDGSDTVDSFSQSIAATLDGIEERVQGTNDVDADRNVAAFLKMIRVGEGTSGANGYRTLFGGGLFDSFADHPRVKVTAPLGGSSITSTAAGAYQILERSWDEGQRALQLPDFSPASQDAWCVWKIQRRGALADVKAGRFDQAVAKCAKEWASLPGSPYGQPVKSLDQVRASYEENGGTYA
jgi:muramidase (phage lysozyme)